MATPVSVISTELFSAASQLMLFEKNAVERIDARPVVEDR